MNVQQFRPWFDERFAVLLGQKVDAFAAYSHSEDVRAIATHAQHLADHGKRFRPYLTYLASGTDTPDEHIQLLYAVELLHLFALIHDDIMDRAESRHDVPCAHVVFTQRYGEHAGNATAILLGDIVLAWAYECLLEYCSVQPSYATRVTQEFTRLVREVTHGQILDVLSPVQDTLPEEAIIEKMTLKTARYTFVQPLRLGFVIAGDSASDLAFAEVFGVSVGIAYQLTDDLLDIVPAEQTGKTRFTDIATRQQTVLSAYIQHSDSAIQFAKYYGSPVPVDDYDALTVLITDSGAVAHVSDMVEVYLDRARTAIDTLRPHDDVVWRDILALVAHRTK